MGALLTSGQSQTVSSGQTVDGTTVENGASLLVENGGVANGTILSGGYEGLQGTDSGTQSESGFQFIYGGGISIDANLTGFGLQLIGAGSEAISTTIVNAGGGNGLNTQEVDAGGIVIDTRLNGSTVENLFGGTGINTVAYGANNEINDRALLVYSGVNAQVSASIFDFGDVVIEGASTRVDITGVPSFYGPFTGEAVIGSSAELQLGEPDSLTSGTIVFGPGGNSTLEIDGSASPTERIAGFFAGDTIIIAGAIDSSAQVSPGLVQLFLADGTEDDLAITTAVDGGIGITTSNDETILTSYVTPSTTVSSGEQQSFDQEQDDYLVQDGGQFSVLSGGAAVGGLIGSAVGMILSGGYATSNIFDSGGLEDVQSGGMSIDDSLYVGATQQVDAGGSSYDPILRGTLVNNGEVAFGTLSGSPASASLEALSGSGDIIQGGSGILTLDGDASGYTGSLSLGSGTLEIGGNTNLNSAATIDFVDGTDPTLQIDSQLANLPSATISGFSTPLDIIDLRAVGYTQNSAQTPLHRL